MPKFTPLSEIHKELDAKCVPFQGWSLPQSYPGGALAEHKHTVKFCSVFDSSFSGKIRIAGPGCAGLLDNILLYPVSPLSPGETQENFLLSENGCFADCLAVCRMAEEDFFLTVSCGRAEKEAEFFSRSLPEEVTVQDLSLPVAQLDLRGPEARSVLLEAEVPEASIPPANGCGMIEIAGIRCIIRDTACSGIPGYALYCGADNAIDLWDELTCIEPVRPAGIGAADSLRLEKGRPAAISEYTENTIPSEVDLPIPEKEFYGKAALLQKAPGRRLYFARLEGRQAARSGDKVQLPSGKEIGTVTSGSLGSEGAFAFFKADAGETLASGENLLFISGKSQLTGVITPYPVQS